jgi:hypothetical protein
MPFFSEIEMGLQLLVISNFTRICSADLELKHAGRLADNKKYLSRYRQRNGG